MFVRQQIHNLAMVEIYILRIIENLAANETCIHQTTIEGLQDIPVFFSFGLGKSRITDTLSVNNFPITFTDHWKSLLLFSIHNMVLCERR